MIRTTSKPSKLEQQKALLGGAVPVKAPAIIDPNSLPGLVKRAASQLASASTAAEVLDARDAASVVYDAAKKAARLAKAKGAHDELIAKAHRAQADALEIEAQAKRRLADEYDAAQERGEVAGPADRHSNSRAEANKATAADIGLTHKDIHEARTIRDAEKAEPGIVRKVLDEKLEAGQEPTKAVVREAVSAALGRAKPVDGRTDEDREFDALMGAWRKAGAAARTRFLAEIEFQAKADDEAHEVAQDDGRAAAKAKAPAGVESVSRGVGDRAPTATSEHGRDGSERRAPSVHSDPLDPGPIPDFLDRRKSGGAS